MTEYLKGLVQSVGRWVQKLWVRILSGGEPIIVRGFAALVVTVALKFGFDLSVETVLMVVGVLVPTLAASRLKVDPSDNPVNFFDVVKAALTDDPDIEVKDDAPANPTVPSGEPDWLAEYAELGDA